MIYQIVPRDAGSFHSFAMTLRHSLRWERGGVRVARGEGNEFNPSGRGITKESIID